MNMLMAMGGAGRSLLPQIFSTLSPLADADFARWDRIWVLPVAVALAVMAYVYGANQRSSAAKRLGRPDLVERLTASVNHTNRTVAAICSVLALALCALGLLRPQYGGSTDVIAAPGLDIVLVVDYSKSMLARDVYPSRNERLEAELSRFLAEASTRGDRVGLVVFAGASRGMPLTRDARLLQMYLQRADPKTETPGGTAIGKALNLALELLREARVADAARAAEGNESEALGLLDEDAARANVAPEQADQVIILLTDGEDTTSRPRDVAGEAAKLGVRIYTVGIGSKVGEPIQQYDESGEAVGFVTDADGKPILTRLDEDLLLELANVTGGKYVHVDKDRFGLDEVREAMADLRTAQREETVQVHRQEGVGFLLVPALVLLTLSLGLGERRTMAGSGAGSGRAGAKHRPVNDADRKQGALAKGDRNT